MAWSAPPRHAPLPVSAASPDLISAAPPIARSSPSGIQSGDVSADSAVIWARADRPARMQVECVDRRELQDHHRAGLRRRAAGRRFHRQGAARRPAARAGHLLSRALRGHRRARRSPASRRSGISAPRRRREAPMSFVWSGDTAGQGWGIDDSRGGMRTYRTMLDNRPDFFIHSGDHIYADCPVERGIEAARSARSGETSSPRRSRDVAQTPRRVPRQLQIQSGSTENLRAFHAAGARCSRSGTITRSPTTGAPTAPPTTTGYAEDGSSLLVRAARRAFHEFMPMRAYARRPAASTARSPTGRCSTSSCSTCAATAIPPATGATTTARPASLGATQLAWLKRELLRSRATWKVIAADLPIGLFSEDAHRARRRPAGAARARDRRSAVVHEACRRPQHGVADRRHALHGGALLRSEPRGVPGFRAVLGVRLRPAACRHLGAGAARQYVRPAAVFQKGCSEGRRDLAPCFGLQFFGHVDIDGETEVMTVTLKDVDDRDLWSVDIEPRPGCAARPRSWRSISERVRSGARRARQPLPCLAPT